MTSRQPIHVPQRLMVGHYDATHVVVTVYSDVQGPAAQYVADSAGGIQHPREACLTDHRMIAVSVGWPEPRPYGRVLEVLEQAQEAARAAGWALAAGIEGVLDTGTVVGDLVVVADWPAEPAVCGYNAAHGFVFEAEQVGEAVVYSAAELDLLRQLAQQVYRLMR